MQRDVQLRASSLRPSTRCRPLINTQLITQQRGDALQGHGWGLPFQNHPPPPCQQGKVGLGNCPWGPPGPSGTGSHAAATTEATTKATTEATSFCPSSLLLSFGLAAFPAPTRATARAFPSSSASDDAQLLRGYPLSSCRRASPPRRALLRTSSGPGERPTARPRTGAASWGCKTLSTAGEAGGAQRRGLRVNPCERRPSFPPRRRWLRAPGWR